MMFILKTLFWIFIGLPFIVGGIVFAMAVIPLILGLLTGAFS